MTGIMDQAIRGRAPWHGVGPSNVDESGKRIPRMHKCALCGQLFRPPSGDYAYKDNGRWFCRYQHLADWRKAGRDKPVRKGPQPEKAFGEVSVYGWRYTLEGCKTRIKYCRDELRKRQQTTVNARIRGDKRLARSSARLVSAWKTRLREAEETLKSFEQARGVREA